MEGDHALAAIRPPMPETYVEAVSHPESVLWWAAMDKEYQAFVDTGTFTVVPRPQGKSVIKSRWVYDEKLDAFGNLLRRKARLVAKGYTQRKGVDFDEIFAPTGNKSTLRTLLHVAAVRDWEIDVMDFDNAFLNGDLEEEVYMQQPDGYAVEEHPDWVWRLHKPVYGLKQAPRQWYRKLRERLTAMGFEQCVKEPALFRKDGIWLFIYVDDMVIFCEDKVTLAAFKEAMMEQFKMKDLGPIHHYLKIRIVRDRPNRHIYLLQETFAQKILDRFNMGDCKPWGTPLPVNHDLSGLQADEAAVEKPYAALVGAINYCCTGTRPDLSYANGLLARYMAEGAHGERHWNAGKRLLRYLQGTKNLALRLGGDKIALTGWSDSSYADCADTSRSTLGWCFSLGDGVISWSAKRSSTVADSTTVAEYYALNAAAKEAIFLRDILTFLNLTPPGPTPIFCDSSGARSVATNPGIHHPRMKHLRVAVHKIQEFVDLKDISIHEINTADNIADIFTKALSRDRHQLLTTGLHLHPLPARLTQAAGHSPGGSVGGAAGEATANLESPGGAHGHTGASESP
jgi:histone deacetylase 1/2